MRILTAIVGGLTLWLGVAAPASAQCPPGGGCSELVGKGSLGSYFRVLVPDAWDGDLLLWNHGLELDESTIAPHNRCRADHKRVCSADADCAGLASTTCNKISLGGFDDFVASGKAVGASTFSQASWAAFQSRYDLKDVIRFVRAARPGALKRVIMAGGSGGGAVTVDAMMHLEPGTWIHGAIPMCSASAGGLPTVDAATDIRLVYDYLCKDVPGGRLLSPPDVGSPDHSSMGQLLFGLTVNTCLGALFPSADPVEAAAQADRLARFVALTKFPVAGGFPIVHVLGFSELAMGEFVSDPRRLNGRRPGWNEGVDYARTMGGPEAAAFDQAVERLPKGPGRWQMRRTTHVDFTRSVGARVNYPILSFSGREDYIALPSFQKLLDDAATLGGKDHAMIWGSTPGHCAFTQHEMRAVVETYFEWLDAYGTPSEREPTTEDVLARCLALPGSSPDQCHFDTRYEPPALADVIPPRPDWPEAGKHPLP